MLQIWHRHIGPLRPDHKTTPKWACPVSRDQISKFLDPLISFERIGLEISASNLAYIDDGPLLRPDHKMTPKWAWPGSRDRILHSKDQLLNYLLPADVTSKVNDMFINKNKTANKRQKLKVYNDRRVRSTTRVSHN